MASEASRNNSLLGPCVLPDVFVAVLVVADDGQWWTADDDDLAGRHVTGVEASQPQRTGLSGEIGRSRTSRHEARVPLSSKMGRDTLECVAVDNPVRYRRASCQLAVEDAIPNYGYLGLLGEARLRVHA